jgi:hypothetical protein
MRTSAEILSNSEELLDPLFVVGCARSGTGVLGKAIGRSEEVCYVEETQLIPRYYNRRIPIGAAMRHWRNGETLLPVLKGRVRRLQEKLMGRDFLMELVSALIRYVKLNDYDLKPPAGKRLIDRYDVGLTNEDKKLACDLHEKYTCLSKENFDRMFRVLFKDFLLLSGKRRILEKTPIHALYIRTLKRIFPQAKICFIVRNGRDVAASYMLNFGERKIENRKIRRICKTHRRIQQVAEELRKMKDPAIYHVEYEDLVTRPFVVIEGAFKFLDLPFSDRVRNALAEVRPTPSNWRQLPKRKQLYVEACLGLQRSVDI